jgi:pyridoxamine 5'-phosphate oxidase
MFKIPAPHYNDLETSLRHAWDLLKCGAKDRRSPFHILTVATVDAAGCPDARIMVLREADEVAGRLRFHTDARSDKVAIMRQNPSVSVLAYHPDENIQLRISGAAHIDNDSLARQAAWESTSLYGRRCYLGSQGPGCASDQPTSGLPADVEAMQPTAQRTETGLEHFALLWVSVVRIEWLFLAHGGHRRARFEASPAGWVGRWLIP